MELFNLTEPELPSAFWVSLNPDLPTTMWNALQIGCLTSAAWTMAVGGVQSQSQDYVDYVRGALDYLPFIPNPTLSQRPVAPYQQTVTNDYMVEYNAELGRKTVNGRLPSRFSCVYAFGRKRDAQVAARRAGRPEHEVHAFELRDEGLGLTRVARVNMEVVSVMRLATRTSMLDAQTVGIAWRHYWTGGAEFPMDLPTGPFMRREIHDFGVTWEYLVEGRLDKLIRRH